ncbi:MAG: hypothetical protein WA040_18650 [Anaerolineae bacterium]
MPPFPDFLAPSLILSTLLALLWGTLWFVWRGRTLADWTIDVLAALLGFGLGQLVGWLLGLGLPTIGEVRVVEGSLFAVLVLWLTQRLRRTA